MVQIVEQILNTPIPLILNTPTGNHGLLGKFHIIGTIEGMLNIKGWFLIKHEYSMCFESKGLRPLFPAKKCTHHTEFMTSNYDMLIYQILGYHFTSKHNMEFDEHANGQNVDSDVFGATVPFLVGGIPTPLKNMSSSVGMMTFPYIYTWNNNPHVPNHQPDLVQCEAPQL